MAGVVASADSSGAAQGMPGRYRILKRLAVGGMAEIFVARSEGIEGFAKLVVLKRILPQYAGDGRFIRMFLQEARLAATLQHNHIVQVYDVGKMGSGYFFAMEYVHGVDLRRLVRTTRDRGTGVALAQAVGIVAAVAAGLHYAHDKRGPDGRPLDIVHRDVSPANVLVGFDGSVKLADFGIAKVAHDVCETRPGTLKGKLAYMSPEQCLGGRLDRRSDVFALGVVLYELTTGTLPFGGDSEAVLIQRIIEAQVTPPSQRCPGYPEELERIVLRALARDASERFATARDLQVALEEFALARGFNLGAGALSRYMEDLFGDELTAWHDAQDAGIPLVEHLTASLPDAELGEQAITDTVSILAPPAEPAAAAAATKSRARWPILWIAVGLVLVVGATWTIARFTFEGQRDAQSATEPAPTVQPAAASMPAATEPPAPIAPPAAEPAPAAPSMATPTAPVRSHERTVAKKKRTPARSPTDSHTGSAGSGTELNGWDRNSPYAPTAH